MHALKRDFERQIKCLEKVYEDNDDRRKEIRTLRDQLFSGTSVLESRKSVELSEVTILQGHNIKLLTLVSNPRINIIRRKLIEPRSQSSFSL